MRRLPLFLCLMFALMATIPLMALPKIACIGMSAIVPGSGELALGKYKTGTVMLTADLLALTAYTSLGKDIINYRDSYKMYAETYAGAATDQPDDYYLDLQSYLSSDEYNNYQEMIARNYFLIYGYDPAGFAAYLSTHTYSDDIDWQWQTEEFWKEYKKIRVQYQNARLNRNLALGAILLNRLISMIDVAFTKPGPKTGEFYVSPISNGLMLNYRHNF